MARGRKKKVPSEDVNPNLELKSYLSALEKEYGAGIVAKATDLTDSVKVPTNILLLDILLEGGIPTGTITLFYGMPSSGKSLTSIALAKTLTQQKKFVCLIDTEHSYNSKWWIQNGVDTKYLYVSQPDELEKAIDVADTLVMSKKFDMVIFDSLTSGIPKEVKDKSAYDDQMAIQARRNAKLMQKILSRLQPTNLADRATYNDTIFIGVAHIREKVGFVMGNPQVLPGGHAIKHTAHNIVYFSKGKVIYNKEEPVGQEVRVRIEKSKNSIPYVKGTTDFHFRPPHFNNAKVLVLYAIKYGIIKQAGAWYEYKDIKEQGADKLLEAVKAKDLLPELKEKVIENANQ
jgi:recombination protein RecA